MQEFKIGQTYEFEVIDIRQNGIGNNYIALRYGDRDTFRVKPLPFQEEGELPRYVYCKVIKLNPFNELPILTQDLYKFYSENYKEGEEYAFKIVAIEEDLNTHANYYQLRDSFGITTHRLYFNEQKYELDEVRCFKINKIEERGFLNIVDTTDEKKRVRPSIPDTTDRTENPFVRENRNTEFKCSIIYAPGEGNKPLSEQCDEQLLTIVKTITAFMNSEGGKLYIGVNDNGYICGLNDDLQHLNEGSPENDKYLDSYKSDTDSFELKIRNAVRFHTNGNLASSLLTFSFEKNDSGLIYCCIDVKPSKRPVFVKYFLLYVRTGNQKVLLKDDEITYFISERMKLSIKDVFDEVDFSEAFSIEEIKRIIGAVLNEQKAVPASPKAENIVVPTPPVQIPPTNDEVWNYFTWYNDGSWSFQKDASSSPDVYKEVCVHKSEKDGRILMCYDNGYINVIVPSKARSRKTRGNRYANGWNTEAKLMAVFVMHPMHLIAAFSCDFHSTSYVKVHSISDFAPIESLNAKGLTFINPKLGGVTEYKVLSIDNRHSIPDLIFTKSQTSTTLGIPESSPLLAGQISFLKAL